jgi:hypothetical protein
VIALTASTTATWVIAANRAWANGFWLPTVFTMMAFQSKTTSPRAALVTNTMPTLTIVL